MKLYLLFKKASQLVKEEKELNADIQERRDIAQRFNDRYTYRKSYFVVANVI